MKYTFQHEGATVTVDLITVTSGDADSHDHEVAVDIEVNNDGGQPIGIWLNDNRIGEYVPEPTS